MTWRWEDYTYGSCDGCVSEFVGRALVNHPDENCDQLVGPVLCRKCVRTVARKLVSEPKTVRRAKEVG